MIFSNKIYKISSGSNVSLFANENNNLDLYLFNKNIKKYNLIYSNILKCLKTDTELSYNAVIPLNDNYICVCFDNNMTVLTNE